MHNDFSLLLLPYVVTLLIGPKAMKHQQKTTQTQEKSHY